MRYRFLMIVCLLLAIGSLTAAVREIQYSNQLELQKRQAIENSIKGVNEIVRDAPTRSDFWRQVDLEGTDIESQKPCFLMVNLEVVPQPGNRTDITSTIQLTQRSTDSIFATEVRGLFGPQNKMTYVTEQKSLGAIAASDTQISIQRFNPNQEVDQTIVLLSEIDAETKSRKVVRAMGIDPIEGKSLNCVFKSAGI